MLRYIAPKELRTRFDIPNLQKGTCRLLIKITSSATPIMIVNGIVTHGLSRITARSFGTMLNQGLIERTAKDMYRLTPLGEEVAEAAKEFNLEDNEP